MTLVTPPSGPDFDVTDYEALAYYRREPGYVVHDGVSGPASPAPTLPPWAASTSYKAGQEIWVSAGTVAVAQSTHLSGSTYAADKAAGKWVEVAGGGTYAQRRSQRLVPALEPAVQFPAKMASPPTLGAPRAGNPATAITSGVFLSAGLPAYPSTPTALSTRFAYRGGNPVLANTYYVNTQQGVGQAWNATIPFAIEGYHYGTQIDYGYRGQGSTGLPTRVWVDGQPAEDPFTGDGTQDGAPHLRLITFSTAAWRRIRIEFDNTAFWGIWIGPTDSWVAAPQPTNRLLVIGDSYGAGTGATFAPSGFSWQMGRALGFDDVWNYCLGGTGLLQTNGSSPTYRGRSADWAATSASSVCIEMSINDDSTSTTLLNAELALLVSAVQAALPNADVWILGPAARGGSDVASKQTRDTAFAAQAAALGIPYATLVNAPVGPLWTGTGSIESPAGTGNSDIVYHGSGGLASHPSQAGHDMIARAAAQSRYALLSAA